MSFGTPQAKFNITAEDKTKRAFASAKAGMGDIKKTAMSMAPAIGSALAVGGFARMANQALGAADEIDNLANQMGTSLETTQTLKVLTDDAGLSMGTMVSTINKLSGAQARAVVEGGKLEEAFLALGISAGDLKKLSTEQLLERVAQAMRDGGENAEVQNAALLIMGDRSAKLNSVIEQLASGITDMNEALKQTGQIMGEDVVRQGDQMEQQLTKISRRIDNIKNTMATTFMRDFFVGAAAIGELSRGRALHEAGRTAVDTVMGTTEVSGTVGLDHSVEQTLNNIERNTREGGGVFN